MIQNTFSSSFINNALSHFDSADPRRFYRKGSDLERLATHFVKRPFLENLESLPMLQEIPDEALSMKCSSPVFVSYPWKGSHLPDDTILTRIKEFIPNEPGTGIWIDYCCLPQKRRDGDDDRTEKEKLFFLTQLQYIPTILLKSQLLVLWDNQHVNRAWCFIEFLISDIFKNIIMKHIYHCKNNLTNPVNMFTQTYDPPECCFVGGVEGTPVAKMLVPNSLKDLPAQFYNSLLERFGLGPTLLTDLLRRVQPNDIDWFFEQNRFICTNPCDIDVLKQLFHKVCNFAGEYDVKAIKWSGKISYKHLIPYIMANTAEFTVNFSNYRF